MKLAAPLSLALALALAACAPTTTTPTATGAGGDPTQAAPAGSLWMYEARQDTGPNGEPITVPAVKHGYLNDLNRRQQVAYNGTEAPNTIVVDPYARVLYHVLGNGQAMRFGIAVGRAGKGFSGTATIRRKAAWPSWTPTANMVRTEPELYYNVRNGLPGGLTNPLGARALYLYQGNRDTMYRIHGTLDPSSIGKATSAGCIRLFNQDIMDLFDELPTGSVVKVRSQAESVAMEGPMVETPQGYMVRAGSAPAAAAVPAAAVAAPAPVVQTVVTPAAAPAPAVAPSPSTGLIDPYLTPSPVESAVPRR